MSKPIRVLMIPGLAQNKPIFERKTAGIREACGPNIEFVYVEPANVLPPSHMRGVNTQALDSNILADTTSSEQTARAWWWPNAEKTVFIGLDASLMYMRDFLAKEGPFTGIFGFSQGGALAALLVALLERPHLYPGFLVDGKTPAPPFEFGIFVSSFQPWDARVKGLTNGGNITTPTLHVFGQEDPVIPVPRTWDLVAWCNNPRIERHNTRNRHMLPNSVSWCQFFKEYVTSFGDEVDKRRIIPSPSFEATDQPAARKETPSSKL